MKKVFISGPMSGLKDWNFPAFDAAEEKLLKEGFEVVNPAHLFSHYPENEMPSRYQCIISSIKALMQCDVIAYLNGWEDSRGAMLEMITANELGLEFMDAETLLPIVPNLHDIRELYDRRRC